MDVLKLTGGTTIGVPQERAQMPLYGDPARMRVGSPGTMLFNTAMGVQFSECCKVELGTPETKHATVVLRQIEGKLYLVVAPAKETGSNVYEIKYESKGKVPVVRMLKPLFDEAKITLRPDIWYDMASIIVQDDTLGRAVAGIWTDAEKNPRGDRDKEVAAGEQTESE